ncbi:hypothetical protein IW967_00350 [Alicyclobacillus mali]|uniref:Uncharacterized protein n=1 Tax=Alicyclobacillus mali (ex Roth et al. 2021) TaxID=1123961 RepID=A0ABS0EZ82_9BACL|nr:hypothetical protein [Alicyclobacillus mali (ex Roth et al. 2021)]MBF8376344.1 hypothetical protein [Alicyclobacillus mali (ex Roth et al. 2021)]
MRKRILAIGTTAALALGTVVSFAAPTAFAATRGGMHFTNRAPFDRIPSRAVSLQQVEANASIVNTLYQQYESLLPSSSSTSTLPSAITNLISELQTDISNLQSATSVSDAQQTIQQIEQEIQQAESQLRSTDSLSNLEQQISTDYTNFTNDLNTVENASSPTSSQLAQLWSLENTLESKLRQAIIDLGGTPTTTSTSTSSTSTSS